MMKPEINCIIIEDQPPAQRLLKKYISEVEHLNLIATLPDTSKAKDLISKKKVDLFFLDIHLPKVSGIDFLKSLPKHKHPKIILTTAFPEYALESYEFNVVDYLLKPFSKDRFNQSIQKLDIITDNNTSVIIKSGHDLVKIDINDIIFIKSDSDYTEVNTTDKIYLSKDTLRQWLEKLNHDFSQIHKSFIVNTNYVEKISGNKVFLIKDNELPIGRVYKKTFTELYTKEA